MSHRGIFNKTHLLSERTKGLRRDTQVAVFAQLQVAQLQDASG
jgi:hypothetical protein